MGIIERLAREIEKFGDYELSNVMFGMTRQNITLIRSGKTKDPRFHTVEKIADALGYRIVLVKKDSKN